MTQNIHLYQSQARPIVLQPSMEYLIEDIELGLEQEQNYSEILFITSFPPRECGIATYSLDLINALNDTFEQSFKYSICALETESQLLNYQNQPKFILNVDDRNAFIKTAFQINKNNNIKLVVVQHEFGFFANKEADFKSLYEHLIKPIIFVFHTVLPEPNDGLKTNVQNMTTIASSIIVMTHNAAAILINEYDVSPDMIQIIPHGTHLVPPLDRKKVKKIYNLSGKKVLSTFGLLSSSKSIETTLDALPAVVKNHPEVLFLVLGITHPSIVEQEGERYRNMLEEKVIALNLQDNVRFVNKYLSLASLLEYLQLTDIYLFTSNDPNQAVSGTFSYAVSCGCPVISTPIPHAKEVLSNDNGIIVDFGDSTQFAKAINSLLADEVLRAAISSNSFHVMASTAWQNSAIAHALLFETVTANTSDLTYKIPPINLAHIQKLTTSFGMIQFSKISKPDIHSGYTLDDNARAMIAVCQHYEMSQTESDLSLIKIYMNFIKHCLRPSGLFLNYVDEHKELTQQNYSENLDDSNGRAIWALGYASSLKDILPKAYTQEADDLLQKSLKHLESIHSTRAMSFIIKGLQYQDKKENIYLIKLLADRLVKMYKHTNTDTWHWYEDYLTYGNSLLPEAMLCAYVSIKDETYKRIAIESFEFLLSKIFVDGRIKVISNKGWHIKGQDLENNVGGEQPIDISYTILALEKFYSVFNETHYKEKAEVAFSWFLGNNHLHQIVYNPCTGGCYDGVEEFNVNLNQGAESSVSYLMARLAIERLHLKHYPIQFKDEILSDWDSVVAPLS